jgi:hypothetical protein
VRKAFVGLAVLSVAAGVAGYLYRSRSASEEVAQITFDDGSVESLSNDSIDGQQFTDIARKLAQIV